MRTHSPGQTRTCTRAIVGQAYAKMAENENSVRTSGDRKQATVGCAMHENTKPATEAEARRQSHEKSHRQVMTP